MVAVRTHRPTGFLRQGVVARVVEGVCNRAAQLSRGASGSMDAVLGAWVVCNTGCAHRHVGRVLVGGKEGEEIKVEFLGGRIFKLDYWLPLSEKEAALAILTGDFETLRDPA